MAEPAPGRLPTPAAGRTPCVPAYAGRCVIEDPMPVDGLPGYAQPQDGPHPHEGVQPHAGPQAHEGPQSQ